LIDQPFDREKRAAPEEIERLRSAFDSALRTLNLVDRNDPICEIVARKMIKLRLTALAMHKRSPP
jgi:hypothetical protein